MQVGEIMTAPAVTVSADATLHDAIGTMLQHRIGSVVVTDPGPVGILTRSDVLRTIYRREGAITDQTAADGMSSDIVTTTPTAGIEMALRTMEGQGIKKLPVRDDFELVGIVTMTDIARHQPERVREVRATVERKDEWTD
ncbi:MAG: cyclic nucleotide-binding/CBS domain-containing protein [Halanaeroarchaeum sp.]